MHRNGKYKEPAKLKEIEITYTNGNKVKLTTYKRDKDDQGLLLAYPRIEFGITYIDSIGNITEYKGSNKPEDIIQFLIRQVETIDPDRASYNHGAPGLESIL